MKRLTLAMMCLTMLFFGMGSVSAQQFTLGAPTPPSGSTVKPGAEITFNDIPAEAMAAGMTFILYTLNDEHTSLEATYMELMMGMESMFVGMDFKVAMAMDGEWMLPVSISESGSVTLRARLAVPVEGEGSGDDDDFGMGNMTLAYSDIVTATYTVEGEVAKPTAPTFSPEAGEVEQGQKITLTNGYVDNPLYMIYYSVNNSDESVFQVTDYDALVDLEEAQKLVFYTGPFAIDASQTIKAATAQVNPSTSSITWSDVVTAVYTIKETPVQPETYMTFAPTTETGLTLVSGAETELWIRPADKDRNTEIYYRILTADGADQNAPIGETDKKVTYSTTGGGDWNPIKVTESMVKNGKFIIKAAAKKNGQFFEAVTKTYEVEIMKEEFSATVKVDPMPTEFMIGETYTFTVSATAGEEMVNKHKTDAVNLTISPIETGIPFEKVEYRLGEEGDFTALDEDLINDVMDISLGKFGDFANKKTVQVRMVMAREKKGDVMLFKMGITTGYSFMDAEVLAVTTINKPCVGRAAAEPTFSPDPGCVKKGTAVTLACETEGAEIHYTLDGSEPTAQSTKYTTSIVVNKLTSIKAVAVKDGKTSFISAGDYSLVGIPQGMPASGKVVYDSLVTITLSEDTPDTKIYYTVDGTEPTAQSTVYTAPFKLQARTLKVVAIAGEDQSPVITREYVLMPAIPVASAAAGKLEFGTKIELTCATPGAEIYWMLGGTEQVSKDNGTKYEGPIEIKVSTILKAIAYYNGEASKPMSCKYTVNVAAPAFSAPAGWVAEGTELVMTTESAALDTRPDMKYHIVYTTDGTDPEVESQAGKVVIKNGEEYESPIELTEDVEFKAIAWLRTVKGYDVSPVSSAAYKVLATPTFDRMDGLVEAGTKVVIECATEDAKIYYTTDESDPTAESTPYTAAVVINETTTLKAIAVMDGVSSAVAEGVFMVVSLEAPAFSVAEGEVNHGTELTWTWDEVYNDAFLQVGVIYVANGKDGDLDIDVEIYQALYEAGPVEGAHEDGQVYLYMGDEDEPGYTIAKDVTVKARMIGLTVGEADDEEAEPVVIVKFSDIVTKAYTVKAGTADTVAVPTFSVPAGEVEKGTKVEIACATEGAKIYYTVDGSEPTAQSAEYKEAIVINEALTVKAVAIKGEAKSAVATAAYTVKDVANEELELSGASVYPNPSDGVFSLELPVAATVEVFAANGVLRQRLEAGAGIVTLNIERSGIYFLRITGEGRTTVKRVIVR